MVALNQTVEREAVQPEGSGGVSDQDLGFRPTFRRLLFFHNTKNNHGAEFVQWRGIMAEGRRVEPLTLNTEHDCANFHGANIAADKQKVVS